MGDIQNNSRLLSGVQQTFLTAQELHDAVFLAPPTDQSRERRSQLMDVLVSSLQEYPGLQELDQAIEASLQSLGSRPLRAPPASKEVIANLPKIIVTEETLMRCTECAVCSENLVINDKMQELPCKHMFHSLCLLPWLDKRNSCPVCRHELPTDDEAYESWKKSEKEAEKERRDAANSVC